MNYIQRAKRPNSEYFFSHAFLVGQVYGWDKLHEIISKNDPGGFRFGPALNAETGEYMGPTNPEGAFQIGLYWWMGETPKAKPWLVKKKFSLKDALKKEMEHYHKKRSKRHV